MTYRRIFAGLFGLIFALSTAVAYAGTVESPSRTQGLLLFPASGTNRTLVDLAGPGKFVTATLTKQGGSSDLTFIRIDIDGRNVVATSIATLRNFDLTESNPSGIVLRTSPAGIDAVTIGFPETLTFKQSFRMSVTVQETSVVQIIANVVHGR